MKYTIYKHTNKINGKSYIGQTLQVNLQLRFKNGRGYRQQKVFFKAILKYSWENFTHEVLEIVDTKELANEREKYYIKLYNTYIGVKGAQGYNATPGGDGGSGFIWAKEVYQIDLDGNIVTAYESKMEAARSFGVNNSAGVALSCKNLAVRTFKGYYWCHVADYESFCALFKQKKSEQLQIEYSKKHIAEKHKQDKLLASSVCQFNAAGKLLAVYNSMSEAEAKTGISHSSISLCCSGKNRSAGNFYWCFLRDKEKASFTGLNPDYTKEILQLDSNKNIIARFSNVLEAQRKTGLINIHTVCFSNKLASTGGYYWCLAENFNSFQVKPKNYKTSKIRQVSLTGEEIRVFESISDAVKELNLKQSLISKCCAGERKSTGGFRWEYIKE